jgi:hypothetical protein
VSRLYGLNLQSALVLEKQVFFHLSKMCRMKHLFYFLFCYLFLQPQAVLAQITGPDTVCVGTAVSFNTNPTATTYKWDFSPVSVIQPISPLSSLCSTGGVPAWSCFNKDGGNYYLFTTDYNTGHIRRYSFGASIYSTPVVTDFGALGATSGNTEGIDIVKDSATGNWYGVVVNYTQLIVLNFGSTLSATPTATATTYPQLSWPHQVTLKRYAGGWLAFAGNRNGTVVRFDFGALPTGSPTVTTLPTLSGVVHSPCNFSLYQQGGNWYMIFSNLLNGSIGRYNFGANLQNNTPTGSLITPAGTFSLPRPINLLVDCQNHLIGYVITESGQVTRLDFAGNITTTPTLTSLASLGLGSINSTAACAYSDSFTIATLSYSGTVKKFHPLNYATPPQVNYYTTSQSYTFATPGLHSVTLFDDMGYASGPSVFCKQIYAKPCSAGHPPHFVNGPRDSVLLCGNEIYYPVSLDTILSVIDTDATDPLTWSIITPPLHGIAAVAYTTASTGGVVYPSGLTYTPALGYMGVDSFKVGISDGANSDSITVKITMNPMSPDPGTISGVDTVCPGDVVTMSETVTGGTWSSTAPLVATISGTGVVTAVAYGIDTIKYFVDNGCGIANAYKVIYVRKNCLARISANQGHGPLSIHPNPSKGTFVITVSGYDNERVQIVVKDVLGRQVNSWIMQANEPFKAGLDLPSGLYVIEAVTKDGKWNEKIHID